MAKGYCPVCKELVGISPNGVDPKLSNKRQRTDVHKSPDKPELCDGSGKDI